MATRYVGIDLAKRSMEACILDGGKTERHGLTTGLKGRQTLVMLLRKTDIAGYEVCAYGNRLARILLNEVGCGVTALNAGDPESSGSSGRRRTGKTFLKTAKYLGNGSSPGHAGGGAVFGAVAGY